MQLIFLKLVLTVSMRLSNFPIFNFKPFSIVEGRPNTFSKCPCSSVVERILGKDEVGGSIPLEGSSSNSNNLSTLNNINHG